MKQELLNKSKNYKPEDYQKWQNKNLIAQKRT